MCDNIYSVNPDGTEPTSLTPGFSALEPDLSPDGTKTVVESGAEIYVMNADGTGPANPTTRPGGAEWPRQRPVHPCEAIVD